MSEKKPWYEGVLRWARDIIPTGLAIIISFYQYMRQKVSKEEARHEKTKLEKELVENELTVIKENADKSDADIISEAIRDGAKRRKHNKQS